MAVRLDAPNLGEVVSIEESFAEVVRRVVREELRGLSAPSASPDELLSLPRAAELADVSVATIRRWVSQGLLKRYGSSRAIRVRRDEVLSVHPVDSAEPPDVDEVAARLMGKKG